MNKSAKTMIDLPSGWMYGFPKELPENVEDFKSWLIQSGYPEKDVDFAIKHCRMWRDEPKKDEYLEFFRST